MTKTDTQLKQDIEDELRWEPKINAAQIGVTVKDGAVSLLGNVDTYAEKWVAEQATKKVSGVRTVAQDLKVNIPGDQARSDADIAGAVQSALKWNVYIPTTVTAKVEAGWVTLEGQVDWNFQRDAAARAVTNLSGVLGVQNSVSLKPQKIVLEVKEKVRSALQRQATNDANSISVEVSGGKVTLSGHAASWASIEDAADSAWGAAGVTEVVDNVRMF